MQINIEKRHLYIIAVLFVLLAGVIVIAAVPNPGHSPSEIDWTQPIANALKIGVAQLNSGNRVISFARDAGDNEVAGTISYKPGWDPTGLDIVGAGVSPNRFVKIWDILEVYSTLKTPNLCIGANCKTSWPTLTCTTVENTGATTVNCPSGYVVTGCGTYSSSEADRIQGNGCYNGETGVWARCCAI